MSANEETAVPAVDRSLTGPGDEAPRLPLAAGVWGITLLGVLLAWWAWKDGAYFGTVFLPGLIALCIGVVVLGRFAPRRLELRRSLPVLAALAGLTALGGWTLLSAIWSPAPDVAVADAQRALGYALFFGCGLWFCSLLGDRSELALLPLGLAAAFAGVAAVIALLTGADPKAYLNPDGTLDFPLGYRNANAAFFAIGLVGSVGIASEVRFHPLVRGLAVGTATMSLSLFLLTQSRASLPALLIAVTVLVLAAPVRLRTVGWLLLCVPAALAVLPAAISLHDAGDEPLARAVDELREAGRAIGLATLASIAVGAVVARFTPKRIDLDATTGRGNRVVAIAMALLVVIAGSIFVSRVGDPIDWIGERAEEFRTEGSPDLGDRGTRFTFNVGSGRYDIWRVALAEAADAPLLGGGAGSFQYAYSRDREADADVRDAHSVELETLTELGAVGLLLLVVGIAGAFTGAWRSRRAGGAAPALTAVALAVGAYWLVHSSVEWLWAYPAITAATMALLGAACAPGVLAGPRATATGRNYSKILAALAAGLLAVTAVPVLLAERYVNSAYGSWGSDIEAAYDDLARAEYLNPLIEEPLMAEGAIAREAGDRSRAIEAFSAAAEKRPEEWSAHYFVAEQSARTARGDARAAIERALRLNPREEAVRALAERLGVTPPPLPDEQD